MKKKFLLTIVASIAFGACIHVSQTTPTQTTSTNQNNTQTSTNKSPTDSDGNQEVVDYAIDMSTFKFSPTLIEAEPGDTLTIKLTNTQGTHNFTIKELNIQSQTINKGEDQTITITIPANASGQEYEFYCGIGNHRQLGMVGTLRVR